MRDFHLFPGGNADDSRWCEASFGWTRFSAGSHGGILLAHAEVHVVAPVRMTASDGRAGEQVPEMLTQVEKV